MRLNDPKSAQKRGAERGAGFQNIGCPYYGHIWRLYPSEHSIFHLILHLPPYICPNMGAPLSAPLFSESQFLKIYTHIILWVQKACPHHNYPLFYRVKRMNTRKTAFFSDFRI